MSDILIQTVGFVGLACFVVSYQMKSNRRLFLLQMLASVLFCIQFLLLGAYSGCLNLIVAIIRNLMLSKINEWKWVQWKGWVPVFSAVCVVILVFTWQGPLSILPFLAMISSMIGFWSNNAQKIRLSILACSAPSWLLYNGLVGSAGGVINEIITIVSILISIYRYGWKAMGSSSEQANQ